MGSNRKNFGIERLIEEDGLKFFIDMINVNQTILIYYRY